MNTEKRAVLPIHDIGEFVALQETAQAVVLLAERVSGYDPDNMPAAIVLHEMGEYMVFNRDPDYPTIYHDRTGGTPGIVHIQLYPDYLPNNTGIFYTAQTRQLVALLDDGHFDTLAFKYGDDPVTVESDAAISTKYAEWLISTHHNFGQQLQRPSAMAWQASDFPMQWKVFESGQVV